MRYANDNIDALGERNSDLRPMLAYDGRPLAQATMAQLVDTFGDLTWAHAAIDGGRVLERKCHRINGERQGTVSIMLSVCDELWASQEYEAYADFELSTGRFWGFQCSECGYDDGEGFCECEHGATLALAFFCWTRGRLPVAPPALSVRDGPVPARGPFSWNGLC